MIERIHANIDIAEKSISLKRARNPEETNQKLPIGIGRGRGSAVDVIRGAHVEATGAMNGIGVVKLMGRHSGFIACHAAIASTDVDAVLIPEVPLVLEGDSGLFPYLERRLKQNSHAVIVVAPTDSVYCWNMARNAVHAAMAGNTELLIGRWHGRFVHVPMPLATRFRKQVDTSGDRWMSVVESTGQPMAWAM